MLRILGLLISVTLLLAAAGCGGSDNDAASPEPSTGKSTETGDESLAQSPNAGNRTFKPLSLNAGPGDSGGARQSANLTPQERFEAVRGALKKLQVLVGQWRGITQKPIEDFKGVEGVEWAWDYSTDEAQPALAMTNNGGVYFDKARLTWRPETGEYELTATDKEGTERVYRGTFTAGPASEPDADGRLQWTFKLQFDEVEPQERKKLVQLVFNQRESDRYQLELYDMRGTQLARSDTIGTQREGTSFALSEDYGERECIISQGLGTRPVTYNGKTYYVCCTGCEREFNEDPAKWVAAFEARQKAKKQR